MFDIVVIGSLNLDLVAAMERLPGPGETVSGHSYDEYPGGKGLNQAVAARRAGASVALVGAVGNDAAGALLRQVVVDEGIDDTWLVTTSHAPTGRALITVDQHAENSIVVVPGANGTVDVSPDQFPPGRLVLAQLEIPLDAVTAALRHARAADCTTMLNPAPARPDLRELLAWCDVVIPNEHEAKLLGGIDAIRDAGVDSVVVTRGARGVTTEGTAGRTQHDAFSVSAVDTTGAGDAFCGALAARVACGHTVSESISFAAAAGALATTVAGAVPSLPTRAAIDELLAATS